jgi:hypothetical protein
MIFFIFFFNIIIMTENEKFTKIIKLNIEFQIIKLNSTEFLVDKNIIKIYKMNIQETIDSIIIYLYNSFIKISIINDIKFEFR